MLRSDSIREEDEDEDEEEEDSFAQGLELSDAIMFPIMAGIMLVGLYYLIQWLKDPEILNKILRWYMSTMSLVSLLTLFAHAFELATSFVFPKYWRGRDGKLRKVDQRTRTVRLCDDAGNVVQGQDMTVSASPLPGIFSWLAYSESIKKTTWDLRGLVTQHWILKFYAHGMGHAKTKVKLSHILSLFGAIGTTLLYNSTTSPFLSNMLGYGLCYSSLLLISPTNLLVGSLVLVGLFFYDITMVFYTPYMVTVATKLDVPIKLQFSAAARKSILGLGDIVLPGIVMAFALRLDLWFHYQRKVKYEETELKVISKDPSTGELSTTSQTKHREVKAPYVSVKNGWADRVWSSNCAIFRSRQMPPEVSATRFPKTYFNATVIGYSLGMLVTLAMLLLFRRGQPALLYLVPGVLGSIYVTAFARGEIKKVWAYTEDGSIDTIDTVVDLDGNGQVIKKLGKLKDGVVDTTKKEEVDSTEKQDGTKKVDGDATAAKQNDTLGKPSTGKKNHHVLLLSLEAPPGDQL